MEKDGRGTWQGQGPHIGYCLGLGESAATVHQGTGHRGREVGRLRDIQQARPWRRIDYKGRERRRQRDSQVGQGGQK